MIEIRLAEAADVNCFAVPGDRDDGAGSVAFLPAGEPPLDSRRQCRGQGLGLKGDGGREKSQAERAAEDSPETDGRA